MSNTSRHTLLFVLLTALTAAAFVLDMTVGSTPLGFMQVVDGLLGTADEATTGIVRHIRLIRALTAILAGMALTASGLQMQTLFRNPLAGPYVLGVSSGASLAVALLLLGAPLLGAGAASWLASLGIAGAAWAGSALVLVAMAAVARRVRDIMVLLILGMMFSSGVGALVQVLQYLSPDDSLKNFVLWTMGSLGDVTPASLVLMAAGVAAGLALGVAVLKPLNLLLLGETNARAMGLDPRRTRSLLFASTALLAGTVTAFCGPIGFIGLAFPHVARAIWATADHRVLFPATALTGAFAMLVCDILAKAFVLPVGTLTALLGIPIVVWILYRYRHD